MMMKPFPQRSFLYCTFLALALGIAGCGDDESNNDEPNAATATFETYNVGLAPGFVANADARLEPVAQNLGQTESDVLCLQEAWLTQNDGGEWLTDQIDTLVDQTKATLPYAYYEITESEATVSCTQQEAEPLKTCAFANCSEVSTDDLAACALQHCGAEIDALPDTCSSCVFGQIGNSLEDILATCTGGGAGAFTYNGHNGLLMLSRYELKNTEFTTLESTIVQRTALHATVSIPEFGDVDVYCTHLAANLSDVPYPGGAFANYKEEQASQIAELLAWVDETATTGNIVLMGDMNTGPAKGELKGEFPEHYTKFLDAGFQSPYLAQEAPECTFCGTNTLNDGDENKAIDHVFLDFEMPVEVVSAERVHTETVDIETSAGATESTNLSDHFGVAVTLRAATP
jgi:endonuclease/exonuclease/phosphatase family metal-dependent hydrolase